MSIRTIALIGFIIGFAIALCYKRHIEEIEKNKINLKYSIKNTTLTIERELDNGKTIKYIFYGDKAEGAKQVADMFRKYCNIEYVNEKRWEENECIKKAE